MSTCYVWVAVYMRGNSLVVLIPRFRRRSLVEQPPARVVRHCSFAAASHVCVGECVCTPSLISRRSSADARRLFDTQC